MAKATTPVQPNAALAGSPVAPQFMDRVAQPSPTLLRKQALKKGELDDDVVADAPVAQDDVIVLAQASTGAVAVSGGGAAAAASPAVLGSLTLPQVLGMGAGALLAGSALSGGSDSPAAPLPASNVAPQSGHVGISGIEAAAPSYTFTEAQLLAKATDANGDKLSVTGVQLAEGQTGSLVNNGDGTWTFTPAVNDDSSIELVYEVTDGRLSTDGSATLERDPATGDVQLLTAGQDQLVFDGFRTVDTVKGVVDYNLTTVAGVGVPLVQWDDKSTFTIGDSIQGNGFTKVELTVDSSEFGLGAFGEDIDVHAPLVEMSGVDELVLKAAARSDFVSPTNEAPQIYFHAERYGDDISTIRMQGVDGMSLHVHDLQADETLALHQETQGDLHVTGVWNDLDIDVSLDDMEGPDAATTSSVSLTEAIITLNAGKDQYLDLDIGLDTTEFAGSGDAVNGDVTLGDIVMVADKSGEIDLDAENRAYAEDHTSSENNAVVGDLHVGNVSLSMAKYADYHDIEFHLHATGEDGSATAGDLTMGKVTITGADHAAFEQFYLHQYAYADVESQHADDEIHAASVGDMYVVGDISVTLASGRVAHPEWGGNDNRIKLQQEAYAQGAKVAPQDTQPSYVTVDATIGDMTVGNISVTAGDDVYDLGVFLSATAEADKGDASIGDLTVGQVELNVLDRAAGYEYGLIDFSVSRSATVDETGDALVGDVNIGDVKMTGGDNVSLLAYVWQSADSDKGNATVGDITVGNVTVSVGQSGTASFSVSQYASAASGDAVVGSIYIDGDVSISAGDEGTASVWLYQYGAVDGGNLVIGDITVAGDIDVVAGKGGDAYASLQMTVSCIADGDTVSFGNVQVGDVTVAVGADTDSPDDSRGEAGWGLYLSGSDSDTDKNESSVGSVTIGDVNVSAGTSASVEFWNDVVSFDDVGAIEFGNISLTVADHGELDYAYIDVSANDSVASFELGNLSIDLGKDASVYQGQEIDYVSVYAYNTIGDVKVGDVDLSVASNTSTNEVMDFGFYFGAGGDDNEGDVSIGNVTFGDFDLSAVGDFNAGSEDDDSVLEASISISSYGDVGNVTLGNVGLLASGSSADVDLYVNLTVSYDAGDVTVGDLSVVASGDDAEAIFDMDIDVSGDVGDVLIGDVALTASGTSAYANVHFDLGSEEANSMGTVVVGNVSLAAMGSSASAYFTLHNSLDSSDAADGGALTIGNLSLAVSNTESATDNAEVYVYVSAHSDLTVGDITLTQGAMDGWGANVDPSTATGDEYSAADVSAYVGLDSEYGDIVIGDITVTGGYSTVDNGDYNDNFDQLGGEDSWLEASADGNVTVGDIDYSAYERYATIDVSDWEGAASITVGDAGSTVYDNDGANTITLGAGEDTVQLTVDNGGGRTDASDVDVIVGFDAADDTIDLNIALDETDISTTSYGSYALFLAAAQAGDEDLFTGMVGSDFYAAVDTDNGDTVDYVVRFEDVVGTLGSSNFIA